jgi:predicted DNA repair protein MutK
MSGLLALLDDVAALAKVAATQLDDVAAHAAKAGTKAAGVVIDDGAVTPRYVHGLPAAREIPIVLQIGRGSLFNKVVILLPAALILSAFLPWALSPLLMLGGAYLCFEGAEKVWHALTHRGHHDEPPETLDAAHLERQRVKGAIKTDFILSAEIMAIALASVEAESIWTQGIVLLVVAVGITLLVYGVVALLVKADDVGLRLSRSARGPVIQSLGRAIVKGMPKVMATLAVVGTGAMLWVGGSIILHGLDELGFGGPYHWIHEVAVAAGGAAPLAAGLVEWFVTATFDGILGLVLGLALIPVGTRVVAPLVSRLGGGDDARTPAEGAH